MLSVLTEQRCVVVVRAPRIADPAGLTAAMVAAGAPLVEITLTVGNALEAITTAATVPGAVVGAGTVRTADQAHAAVDHGARFLVTPACAPPVAAVAQERGVPLVCGAFTPTEVALALDLGATAVKIFPARIGGPAYLRDLAGPFPGIRLVPSGGVGADNAAAFLRAGACAVSVGGSVVPADAVASGDHATVAEQVSGLVRTLETVPRPTTPTEP